MSGRQEYREFRPVELYDVAAVESWLEERDREGYHLLRFRGLYGIFYQDCSVAPSRYRLQPLLRKEKSPPPEMTDAYRELGVGICLHLGGDLPHLALRRPGRPGAGHGPGGPEHGVRVS